MPDDPIRSGPLWAYFREVREAVTRGNAGEGPQPYRAGAFLVHAEAGDVELTIRDVSEEDAVLIANELTERGARASLRRQTVCPTCGHRVPDQDHCVHCRARLDDDDRGGPGDP